VEHRDRIKVRHLPEREDEKQDERGPADMIRRCRVAGDDGHCARNGADLGRPLRFPLRERVREHVHEKSDGCDYRRKEIHEYNEQCEADEAE
jgi:hypothetical protein